MKKIWIVFIISIVISSSVLAFSIKDFLSNFNFNMLPQKDKLTGLTYHQVSQVSQVCTENAVRCNTVSECSGSPCVMKCQNNAWVEYSYCQESCSSGQCVASGGDTAVSQISQVCTENAVRCNTGSECSGSPCVMKCQNNAWVEYSYCQESCSSGQCVASGGDTAVSQISQVCTENAVRCNTGSECSGSPCVMKCQNNAWVEYSYCQESCSSGQCTTSTSPTTLTVPVTNGGTPNQEQCQDGTLSNQCSITKTYFCSNGNLIQNCNACGCPTGKE